MITKAISVRAPWWWFILNAGKDIENRDWSTNFRGTFYLHASKWWQNGDGIEDVKAALGCCSDRSEVVGRFDLNSMLASRGCIVGKVDIVDCVTENSGVAASRSPWFFGRYGFVLANPVAFATPIPCKGALGFFTVPDDVLAQLEEVNA